MKNKYYVTFEWHDVKRIFLDTVRNGRIEENFKVEKNRSKVRSYIKEWSVKKEWHGNVTSEETIKYLETGYEMPGFSIEDSNITPLRKKRTMVWSDCEGDYHHDLFLSGVDNYYSTISKRDKVPGIDIEFTIDFTSMVSGARVVEYKQWFLKQLVDLEASGIDCAVQTITNTTAPFSRSEHSDFLSTRVIVKRTNESSDYREWSALLSPGGWRQIMFLVLIKACDNLGKPISSTMGTPVPNTDYKTSYDPVDEKIIIRCATDNANFYPSKLTESFINSIEEAKEGLRNGLQ